MNIFLSIILTIQVVLAAFSSVCACVCAEKLIGPRANMAFKVQMMEVECEMKEQKCLQ